ncbi:MAG: UDP-N-acetylmuramoyl-L-alanine--D-glutamate ligase [Candidatus Nomurabacteria bacterium]|jgi:UDP-N-acetylmuramoylalanine--D-glutamate ligase|nr:UDP-N-acetylmuramoyl-L-alanine--D-glutamate ligase [Candidatus Nomurabacteria bacterium]
MKIAIVGFGLEGKSNFAYFSKKFPDADWTIFDERTELDDAPKNIKTILGDGAFDQIFGFDLVLRSAGIPPYKISQKENIWSSTREFFAECPAPIIGVTGTKGKGTTCTMIRNILHADGQNAFLVGNIGVPALNELKKITADDVVVFEISSFQLWDLERSPQIAVVLRIEADHLDKHGDMENYIAAKSNIASHQTPNDKIVFYEKNTASRAIAELSAGEHIPYPANIKFDTSVLCVPGAHYIEDATAAIAAVSDILTDFESIEKGLANFTAMPHRLQWVRNLRGVDFYDDNFSASYPSLDVAVKAFPDRPIVLIAGGKDRGLDNFDEIVQAIDQSTVKKVFLIGETAQKIADKLSVDYQICEDLATAVGSAVEIAQDGDVVLMSPGAPSFDMFKSFYDRGEQFQKLVEELK